MQKHKKIKSRRNQANLLHFLHSFLLFFFSFSSCRIKLHEEEHKLMKISTSEGTARRIRIRHKEISLSTHKKKLFWLYLLCNFKQKRQAGVQSNRNRFYGRDGRRYFYLKKIYIHSTAKRKKMLCFILIENEIFVCFAFIVFLLLCAMHKCLYTQQQQQHSSKQISSMNVR